MAEMVCDICGYVRPSNEKEPEISVKPGTTVEDLPDNWACSACGTDKESFVEIEINNG